MPQSYRLSTVSVGVSDGVAPALVAERLRLEGAHQCVQRDGDSAAAARQEVDPDVERNVERRRLILLETAPNHRGDLRRRHSRAFPTGDGSGPAPLALVAMGDRRQRAIGGF